MAHSDIYKAFKLLQLRNEAISQNLQFETVLHSEMALLFSRLAQFANLSDLFRIGCSCHYPPSYIINILILHGGYNRLLSEGIISRADTRYIDSLYNLPYPPLLYNVANHDICAPWITLGAQEALLDMDLHSTSVIEYGSGISTFFFSKSCKECVSFESDSYPEGGASWSSSMRSVSEAVSVPISLIKPSSTNTSPHASLALLSSTQKVLVNIDGEDRTRHFEEWTDWLTAERPNNVVLLVDNSEYSPFAAIFERLLRSAFLIYHHYGLVYGRSLGKQCTSFVTCNPALMTHNVSPNLHDIRWGRMETQA